VITKTGQEPLKHYLRLAILPFLHTLTRPAPGAKLGMGPRLGHRRHALVRFTVRRKPRDQHMMSLLEVERP
jgi:hypothetical protein